MEATKIEGTRSTGHVLRSTTERAGPSLSVILQQPANAPHQARRANARRAGPAPLNPPAVACMRLLGRAPTSVSRTQYDILDQSWPRLLRRRQTIRATKIGSTNAAPQLRMRKGTAPTPWASIQAPF